MLFTQFSHAKDYQQLKTDIEQTYGIEVEFDNIEFTKYLVKSVVANPHKISPKLREKTLKALLRDLKKYKSIIIRSNIKKVNIVESLAINGRKVAGTLDSTVRYLYLDRRYLGGSSMYKTVFHHEFSSLLIFKYYKEKFHKQWLKTNPKNFSYFTEYNKGSVLDSDTDLLGSHEVFKEGFVAGYGKADFEEDFNTYFQLLLGNPVRLANLEVKYPLIRKKAELLREFYYGIVAATIKK